MRLIHGDACGVPFVSAGVPGRGGRIHRGDRRGRGGPCFARGYAGQKATGGLTLTRQADRTYQSFLKTKEHAIQPCGFDVAELPDKLYDWQRSIVRWAVRMGRCAVFADCGLGKTFMQVAWAQAMQQHSGGQVLIVAPLCVASQTIREAKRIGVDIVKVTDQPSLHPIQITNYERLHHFVGADYAAIVLDESSILKSIDGKTRTMLLSEFTGIPYRLCCTATPSPNDISELGNHSQFVGAMDRAEMLATYFVHDDQHWRIKGHAEQKFYEWMATWSVFLRSPADIGYSPYGFDLPALEVLQHVVEGHPEEPDANDLFAIPDRGLSGRRAARRRSIGDRVERVKCLIHAEPDRQWLVWCGLNDEGRELANALPESDRVLIEGQDSEEHKVAGEAAWRSGEVQTLISKPSIFGFGMNWQHCCRVAFLGLGDSYEQYYQAIRRTWRYGQQRPVDVHIVVSDLETDVVDNVMRKKETAERMASEVVKHMGDIETKILHDQTVDEQAYRTDDASDDGGRWTVKLGDCVERIGEQADDSVGLSVYSPPFAQLYAYSDSTRDMGNCRDYDEFFGHYRFLLSELMRVTKPCRRSCVHVQQVALKKAVDGVIGWRDFRADVVAAHVEAGWIYDGEVVIDKNPQAQAIRTKSKALMFVQKNKDSAWSRPAMADYILLFRSPGESAEPVKTDIDNEEWIRLAHPVWYDIRESDTLSVAEAREEKDEKHICPLQLETIENCIRLWSNKGDVVLDPFCGIGSTGYVAMQHERLFVGIELKESYWRQAVRNIKSVCAPTLFETMGVPLNADGVA